MITENPGFIHLPNRRRQKAEGRRQKAEGRRQKAEGRRQKAEGFTLHWTFAEQPPPTAEGERKRKDN
jgi:hypothetical protein